MNQREAEDEARRREAGAILNRVRQETEPQVGAASERMLLRTRDHFAAGDVDQQDAVEVLGTRIGRIAGFLVFVFLAASLAVTLFSA